MHRLLWPVSGLVHRTLRRRGLDVVRYRAPGADIVELIDRLGVDCVLDVGAFTGTYGRMLRDQGYRGRIMSFEPASENFELLEHEAERDSRWEVKRIAVGSGSGVMELRLVGSPGSNSLLVPNDYARNLMPGTFRDRGIERVEVTTVDDVFDEATRGAASVFLKVDTQGFDLEVIRGAAASLERLAAIQVELSLQRTYEEQPGYLEVLAVLADRGFAPAQIHPTYRDSTGRIVECDCVLVR